MLNKANALKGYTLHGLDGEIGKVKEFYFDDRYWTIRYLVADTDTWLKDRQVLISPYALTAVNTSDRYIDIDLTIKQIEHSPSLETDKPVSRQFEDAYSGYYGLPGYGVPYMWGPYPFIVRDRTNWREPVRDDQAGDHHLRSTREVSGYNIQATDGEIGHVKDFLIDEQNWAIRYLIVDTRNWWPGKKVLLSPRWIDRVSWSESTVFVDLLRETVKQSPEYTEDSLLTREYETGLHQSHGRHGYWVDEEAPGDTSD